MNRIFLIGYMGCGKTTVGKKLAAELNFRFVDMDHYLEEKLVKSVAEIFAENGEEEFRKLEQNCLHEVAEFENTIISTGGGAPCFFDNVEYMNTHGLTVYIKMSVDELSERLENSRPNKRPLIDGKKGDELKQFIKEGLSKRESFYNKAGLIVDGNNENVVYEIIENFTTN